MNHNDINDIAEDDIVPPLPSEPAPYMHAMLQYSTPSHVSSTAKCLLIGPVPRDWVKKRLNAWIEKSRSGSYFPKSSILTYNHAPLVNHPAVPLSDHLKDKTADEIVHLLSQGNIISALDLELPESLEYSDDDDNDDDNLASDDDDLPEPLDPLAELSQDEQRSSSPSPSAPLLSDYQNMHHHSYLDKNILDGPADSAQNDLPQPLSPVGDLAQPLSNGSYGSNTSLRSFYTASSCSHAHDEGPDNSHSTHSTPVSVQSSRLHLDFTSDGLLPLSDVSHPTLSDLHFSPNMCNPTMEAKIILTSALAAPADRYTDYGDLLKSASKKHAKRDWGNLGSWHYLRTRRPGEIIKAAKFIMVRKSASRKNFPSDFYEYEATDTTVSSRFQEYALLARFAGNKETPIRLEFYSMGTTSRLSCNKSKKPRFSVDIGPAQSGANLYSALDKSFAIWTCKKSETDIYILKHTSPAVCIEWYAFFSEVLGWKPKPEFFIAVPDIDLTLRIKLSRKKFRKFFKPSKHSEHGESDFTSYLINRVLAHVSRLPQFESAVKTFLLKESVGLAWKRFDCLEWVYGPFSERILGTRALREQYNLELRARVHYPTCISSHDVALLEPSPIEGFVVCISKAQAKNSILREVFMHKQYMFTADGFICFAQAKHALPPLPESLLNDYNALTIEDVANRVQPENAVDWCPLNQSGDIEWYEHRHESETSAETAYDMDNKVRAEKNRRLAQILNVSAFIDSTEVTAIERFDDKGEDLLDKISTAEQLYSVYSDQLRPPRKASLDTISEVASREKSILRIGLKSGASILLKCENASCCDLWIDKLYGLVNYWKARNREDVILAQTIHKENLDRCKIDPQLETQFRRDASQWEMTQAMANPMTTHMCLALGCRTVQLHGILYRKFNRNETFVPYYVLLCRGVMLLFARRTSKDRKGGVYRLEAIVDLRDSYVVSGISTSDYFVPQKEALEALYPGTRIVPRIYKDGVMSMDEDYERSFMLWNGKSKLPHVGSQERRRVKAAQKLLKTQRTMIFMARSYQEREKWVTALNLQLTELYMLSQMYK
ncbi:hypothetical protein CANCADRAFT_30113 [Tortispora caseinolytica NRRL Y-17796]|uniref:PH domain-containing protein n=1 Tax=Tortispora caseinolytica NRRL Y-17796 TaxID=767744 RepID=A0A1E4TJ91_9ASCO|nr:hypothetical protein CANCADRAFT_30113 [Tortispora caseinolytica NRRL Y-17796]